MEWSEYTFAKAIIRTTESVHQNARLAREEKIEHLEDLLCLMILKLPKDWYSATREEARRDCDPDDVLVALDKDLRMAGYQPAQYAVFGALRKLALTIQDLYAEATPLSMGSDVTERPNSNSSYVPPSIH